MNSSWVERHGGIWINRAETKDQLVSEHYDAAHDAFTLIWQRASDRHFQVEYLVKGEAGPQWALPFWGNIAGEGIFGTLDDARAHLKAIRAEHERKLAGA